MKEKGKRLILCEKINQEILSKKNEFLEEAENQNQNEELLDVTDGEKKEAIDRLEGAYKKFNEQSLSLQEQNIRALRSQLLNCINKAKSFDAKTQYINNKIEYD